MAAMAAAPEPLGRDDAAPAPRRASTTLLVAGILSRTWLWFVAGCVLVTLLPLLFGWRPFVVESGSMMPRIAVGDVVLAAPVDDAAILDGRVAVFDDPDVPDRTKTHRVIGIDASGRMTTKGDANPTADSGTIAIDDVRGMGRLLVQFVGLPMIWASTHQWGWLLLLGLSLVVAGLVAARDRDEDDEGDDDEPGDPAAAVPPPTRLGAGSTSQIAASRPADPGLRRWSLRAVYAGVLALTLALPSVGASFAATTVSTASSWTVRLGSPYVTVVTGLAPLMWWRMDDTSATNTVPDSTTGNRPGQYLVDASSTYVTKGVTGALVGNTPNTAATLSGAGSCVVAQPAVSSMSAPGQFSAVVWFQTTSGAGGKLLGFESTRATSLAFSSGGRYDRQLYLDANGQVWFGMMSSATAFTAVGSSAAALNDGAWHMAAGVKSSSGMSLYVDGALVASNTMSSAQTYSGWWRAGCGNLSGWNAFWNGGSGPTGSLNQARDFPVAGSLDEISIWNSALTATQVASMWTAR